MSLHPQDVHVQVPRIFQSLRDYHTKWSQSEKDNYHMISLIYGIIKMEQNFFLTYLKNRNRLTDIKNKFMVTKGENRGRDKLGVSD